MLLLGHRGCRGTFTENTFAAFDHALGSGCDGFEFDVRRTADEVPVVWHDARLRGRFIARLEYGSLQERCLSAGRMARRQAIALCDLEAVLARYASVAWMDIEVKVPGVERQVAGLVRRYPPARGFVISSFRRRVLLELHRIDPSLPLGIIFDRMPLGRVWRKLPVEYVMPKAQLVTAARVRQFHADGKKVLTWTVNRASAMRRLAEAGVDGMIGDDPAMLAEGMEGFKVSKFQGFEG
ncbi:MAG: glycerophosphodiester phosphodiesterase [Candidatus Korobacteraceae bacterium]